MCKLGYVAAGSSFAALGAVVFADRIGKGIRTAPRDALISLSSRREGLGLAFGVHRALDTTGAMLGPLVAFALLAMSPDGYDAIFIVSFLVAVLGVAVLVLMVEPARRAGGLRGPAVSWRDAVGLLAPGRFRGILVAAGVLGLVTISDAFLYLGLQRQTDFDPTLFPLLFTATSLAYMLLAVPVGAVADRVGRGRTFLAGHGCSWCSTAPCCCRPAAGSPCSAYLVAFGAFYAATDGVLERPRRGGPAVRHAGDRPRPAAHGHEPRAARRIGAVRRRLDRRRLRGGGAALRRGPRHGHRRRLRPPASERPAGCPLRRRGRRLRPAVSRRAWILLGLTAACVVAAVVVVALSASGTTRAETADDPQAVALPSTPYVVFLDLDSAHPQDYGRVAVAPLDDLRAPPTLAQVACERVYFSVGGGLCLEKTGRFPVRYKATILDTHLRPVRSLRVPGVPSRTRVSADGRWGSTTTFVSGHSYAELGAFSTHAMIIDMATGRKVIDNLEDLAGHP